MVLPTCHHPMVIGLIDCLRGLAGGGYSRGLRQGFSGIGHRDASDPPVAIGHANDVVLAEIRSRLHLDELQRQLAGIFEPVLGADRNVN